MIDASAVLPENDVPEHVVNAGLAMESLADFAPSFLGPATLRDPAAAEPEEQEDVEAEEPCNDGEHCDDSSHGDEDAPEHAVPIRELTAETLIGLHESGLSNAAQSLQD